MYKKLHHVFIATLAAATKSVKPKAHMGSEATNAARTTERITLEETG